MSRNVWRWLGIEAAMTGLATALGGGLDLSWTRRITRRVVDLDALRTRVFEQPRHHVSLSAGVMLGLGS